MHFRERFCFFFLRVGGLQEVFCFLFFWDSGLMGSGVWVGVYFYFIFHDGWAQGFGWGILSDFFPGILDWWVRDFGWVLCFILLFQDGWAVGLGWGGSSEFSFGGHAWRVSLDPPPPPRDRDYRIGYNIWKFYVIRIDFILDEPVFLVKVFRLFRLEWIFFGVQSVDTVGRCTTLYRLAGRQGQHVCDGLLF
jgi:hypothetical protein